TDGEVVSVVGFAPLGDPIEFAVRGYRISLRSTEAQRILVEPVSD
ncbi:MAG: FeoA domain-containing protein, partial [Planctomycetaceae bacterium]|nr:FeoA domain-containing protein [Planctomycetaceae bacterium]